MPSWLALHKPMSDFPNTQIPENLRELVNAQLMDDETIQWIDQPIPFYFSVGSAIAFGFGLYITVFMIFFVCMIAFEPIHGTVFAPFILIFVYLLLGLFLLSFPLRTRRKTTRTVYALTNLRAIIVQGAFSGFNITSYYPADFVDMFCKQKANGTGNLCFRNEVWGSLVRIRQGFFNIRNVVKVERMLQELKRTKSPEQT